MRHLPLSGPLRGIRLPVLLLAGLFALAAAPDLDAQPTSQAGDTLTLVPGARYAASGFHRLFMGDGYRDLWTHPVKVPVLDLRTFAGGLTPLRSHVGSQTTSLRLQGADGRQYQFRSVDKNPVMVLPEELRHTIAGAVIQDGVSSTHPLSGVLAAEVLEIAGVLHVTPRLFVMPDDPALGSFRETFAGMLGTLEERADENEGKAPPFAGALKITGSDRLFERINKSPNNRVDTHAFLKARLVDLFIGDRDRHRDNWRWARFSDDKPVYWQPISRDHDHAFEKIQGLFPALAALYFPGILVYGPEYGDLLHLTWNGQEVDRRFFAGLEKAVWDSVAADLQARFSDEALERVIRKLPAAYRTLDGPDLLEGMKGRRDRLPEVADAFYRFLARQVDVHATDAPEVAEITLHADRSLTLTLRARKDETPYLRRRFFRDETREIRLRMFGGDDRVVVRGNGDPGITLRIAGGEGDDVLIDSSRAGGLHFYDDPGGPPVTEGRPAKVNRRPYEEWVGSDLDRYPPREWGRLWKPVAWLAYDTDYGAFIGGGVARQVFGFRKAPYASQITVRAGFTTDPRALRIAFDGDFRRENSKVYTTISALVSGIEVLHFFGFGNDSDLGGHRSSFFNVTQQQYHLEPSVVAPLLPGLSVSAGPTFAFSDTGQNRDRYISSRPEGVYGDGDFAQVGARLHVSLDTRDRPTAATRGFSVEAEANVFPALLDVKSAFGRVDVAATTYLSAPLAMEPTLALRLGAARVWGAFPFHEAAFLGGPSSLRGWRRQRFAGDASLFANADLRLFLTRFFAVLPGDFGVFALADAGRVYLDGASPGGWHTAVGGGVWLSFLNRANTFSLGVATNEERTALFARAGFDF
ncbi:BamA/TamA family outer membrane protein [Rhodocaloribacter sp.]